MGRSTWPSAAPPPNAFGRSRASMTGGAFTTGCLSDPGALADAPQFRVALGERVSVSDADRRLIAGIVDVRLVEYPDRRSLVAGRLAEQDAERLVHVRVRDADRVLADV